MKCFLIDDDHDDQEIFKLALEEVNATFECIVARDPVEALAVLRQNLMLDIDLIFIDINMPKMTGKEFITELQKDERLKHIPAFLYSTHDSEREFEEAKNLGAAGFITKPPSIPGLAKLLKNIIEKHVNKGSSKSKA